LITRPFKLEHGKLDVFDPKSKKKMYSEIDAGEPKNIIMWTPLKETTLIFLQYTDYRHLIQFEIKNDDVEDFNFWFKQTYGETNE